MKKKQLYLFVMICSLAGSVWVSWSRVHYTPYGNDMGVNACLFRRVTGLPCPSCGSTRAVVEITKLQFTDAFYSNPAGFLLLAGMIVFPLWVLYDLIFVKNTFYNFYNKAELLIRKRWLAIPLIFIVVINWVWNIYKFTS